MKLVIAFILVLFALAGAGTAQASQITCFGAPADYVAAFDSKDGTKDGRVRYSQGRFYMEWQTWATPEGEVPGHHSEHIHLGSCIPQGQTVSGAYRLDLGYTFHNMLDYKVTSASMTWTTCCGNTVRHGALWEATAAEIASLNAATLASGNGNVTKAFISRATTNLPSTDGLKEIRDGIAVEASGPGAIFQKWQLDARWYVTYARSGVVDEGPFSGENVRFLRLRSIAQWLQPDGTLSGFDYHHSGFCPSSAKWTRSTVNTAWGSSKTICLQVTDGGQQAWLEIDPNHHVHDPNAPAGEDRGVWFKNLGSNTTWPIAPEGGAWQLQVTIPVGTLNLSPGIHKLVFLSDDAHPFRGTWTNVTVLPFRVG